MKLKTKLSLGLGFLFLIILSLAFFFSLYIGKLSRDSGNILKDNYNSIVYAKNMFADLDDMRNSIIYAVFNNGGKTEDSGYYTALFESARTDFEKNLKAENNNITEIHEREYVDSLNSGYAVFTDLSSRIRKGAGNAGLYFNELLPAYSRLKKSIDSISDINMQAVERKNQVTARDSANIIGYMALIGTVSIIIAFLYFWYFPFYISNSISYLSERMILLLGKLGIKPDIKTNDEAYIILQSINLIENKTINPDGPVKTGK